METAKASAHDQARKTMRWLGLRVTPARLAVVRRLKEIGKPISHPELVKDLAGLEFDQATIYRNLIELVDAGLLTRVEIGDRTCRFEMRAYLHAPRHPHFTCADCGEITCLNGDVAAWPGIEGTAIGNVSEVVLKGSCQRCASLSAMRSAA